MTAEQLPPTSIVADSRVRYVPAAMAWSSCWMNRITA
jgi:hypothetical protein